MIPKNIQNAYLILQNDFYENFSQIAQEILVPTREKVLCVLGTLCRSENVKMNGANKSFGKDFVCFVLSL